jgi:hypothetical protein
MGQQLKAREKRRRRKNYLARKRLEEKLRQPKGTKKSVPKKDASAGS